MSRKEITENKREPSPALTFNYNYLLQLHTINNRASSLSKWRPRLIQGPLDIWTEHSNCQIHNRGDSKTLIALLIPNIFLWNYFSMHIKAEGMIQFDIFHVCRKFNELSFAFSDLYSNQPKSEIYPKMPMFEQLKKQVPVNSKKFLTQFRKILIWPFWDYKSSWSGL